MSIFDDDNIIDKQSLLNNGFIVFKDYAILWLKTNNRYLSYRLTYYYNKKMLILWGGKPERITQGISTVSDLKFEILANIEYLKTKYNVEVRIYKR